MPPVPPKGTRFGGRAAGTPNKSTSISREAIALFVDRNTPRLQKWLDAIASGVPKKDKDGKIIPDEFIVRPDPQAAINCVKDLMEYHLPKLQRTDVKVDGSVKVIKLASFADMPDEDVAPAQVTVTIENPPQPERETDE